MKLRTIVLILVLLFGVDAGLFVFSNSDQPNNSVLPLLSEEPGCSLLPESSVQPPMVPEFVSVPKVKDYIKESSIYADIMNRCQRPYTSEERSTNAHETTHFLNSQIRNSKPGVKGNGFYVREGRGVYVDEPKILLTSIRDFIPKNLRSYRYNLYFIKQASQWNDTPTYILDEAIAYWNGGCVSVEDVQQGRWKSQQSDAISGCVDFSIYSIALGMAIDKGDPHYWQTNTQFKKFIVWYLHGAEETYRVGSKMKEHNQFKEQETLLLNLRTSVEAEPMRKFILQNLEGVWLK